MEIWNTDVKDFGERYIFIAILTELLVNVTQYAFECMLLLSFIFPVFILKNI